jgi:enamine deaminase RidA (YjgF/YER057c/UK114 family)
MSSSPPTTTLSSPLSIKHHHNTTNPFEKRFGYHRGVRKGPFIFVSGTTALNPTTGILQHPGNALLQASAAFNEALRAITALGGGVGDVVRVRMFVARQEDTEEVGVAFSGLFNNEIDGVDDEVGTAATMIVVGKGGFVDPEMLVEVELDAVVF